MHTGIQIIAVPKHRDIDADSKHIFLLSYLGKAASPFFFRFCFLPALFTAKYFMPGLCRQAVASHAVQILSSARNLLTKVYYDKHGYFLAIEIGIAKVYPHRRGQWGYIEYFTVFRPKSPSPVKKPSLSGLLHCNYNRYKPLPHTSALIEINFFSLLLNKSLRIAKTTGTDSNF